MKISCGIECSYNLLKRLEGKVNYLLHVVDIIFRIALPAVIVKFAVYNENWLLSFALLLLINQ